MTAADDAYDRLHGLDGCAQAPARALRDAAQFFEREMSRAWGGDATWFTTGKRVADLVAICLRERATDLDADRVAGVRRELSEEPCPACGGSMRFCECMDDPFARMPEGSDDRLRESIARLENPEGVGTGAGEGATGQDTGTAWVTRSTDCPEALAQAHLLGHLVAIQARRAEGFMIGEDYDWLLAAVGRVAGLIAAYGDAEGTPVDYEFLVHHISEAIK